ncbi:Ketol-acid reductoisomerase (NADP(+)) [Buchnera aphidicola (Tetraneura ulmi)]|uniref:ketol-acid reductoisomerase n=1 Tax=Buchnera aphidicola TaxID=9 RepID=UPI0034647D92
MKNYFNTLNFRNKLIELQKCRFIDKKEFLNGCNYLKGKKIVIIGAGSQGLNQGLNLRDSGLDVSFALKKKSIENKNNSWEKATKFGFLVDCYQNLIPNADVVINLTPDKQHSNVIKNIQSLMKKGSCLGYSHGFNIIEMGEKIRSDITVIMVAPKCPGTEVREEYKRGFGVPTLIAVHSENNIKKNGEEIAKAWAYALGSHRAGVLISSFSAEVKSDLMGEQTILCGMLQSGSLVCFDYLVEQGHDPSYACQLVQYGWQAITESLKFGGITLMLDRTTNSSKIRICELSKKIKKFFKPLFRDHMDKIIEGSFSKKMIKDWNNKDKYLLLSREKTKNSNFENAKSYRGTISESNYFENCTFMLALVKAGVELSFEIMVETGILSESAYYESLHELPLIANTIARKRLYEMNLVISDTAEYGNYLFSEKAIPILKKITKELKYGDLGNSVLDIEIDNFNLHKINNEISQHPVEIIGKKLRKHMIEMKSIYEEIK